MSVVFEIPTINQNQTLTVSLAGVYYQLILLWNAVSNTWTLDIADNSAAPILSGVPLVAGVDLLQDFGYLNFGGKLFADTDNETATPPTYSNLGTTGHLYFVTP